ncbi:MAG TPA: HEAT repeat domain-containing protein [Terracidiphilus sp.]|nr:HEAT repeat domain-containing protein [Terracidiphilus sp.]
MNCELAHEQIVAAAYGELPDDQLHQLERHVIACSECQKERQQVLAMKVLADAHSVAEPDPNLVARAHLRLDDAIDTLPPRRWYEILGQRIVNNFASLQAAPVAAALLLIAGAGAGMLGGFEYSQNRAARSAAIAQAGLPAPDQGSPASAAPSLANIAGISSIVRRPNSEIVDVSYNQVVPRQIEGSLDDPGIRQLLMLASEESASPGVRDDSVALLAAECRAGHSCQPSGIRDALMYALRNDRSPKVRQKALEGLEPYVADDVRVRDAVLEAVLNDKDPAIRTAAIGLLEPVDADTSVQQVLYSVSNSDQNPQIRTVSREVLSRVPETQ